jgi:hypothetical protein
VCVYVLAFDLKHILGTLSSLQHPPRKFTFRSTRPTASSCSAIHARPRFR